MKEEELTMMVWAMEHPYLYTLVEIQPPIIIIVAYIVVRITFGLLKG